MALQSFSSLPRTHERTRPHARAGPGLKSNPVQFRGGSPGCRNFPALYISPRQTEAGIVERTEKTGPPRYFRVNREELGLRLTESGGREGGGDGGQ
jgi:hypothetical protein